MSPVVSGVSGVSVVSMRNVFKRFIGVHALNDVSLDVQAGEIFGLLGPNGAGKTTLLRALVDLVRPDTGTIDVLGTTPARVDRRRIAYLPEERGLYERERAGEVVEFFGRLRGLDAAASRRRTAWWLDRLGIGDCHVRRIETLSKGNQQRVQLAAALVADPALALLDEPFSGLDPIGVRSLGGVLQELAHQGTAIVISTHQIRQAETLCGRVAVLVKGSRVRYGVPADLAANAAAEDATLEGVFIEASKEAP